MPAAASENAPRRFLGTGLANRRCSERRVAVDRIAAARGWNERSLVSAGRTDGPDGTAGKHSGRSNPEGAPSWRDAAIRLEPPDGPRRFLANRTARLTGPPIAGSQCRSCFCRSGTPQGAERPTTATNANDREGLHLRVLLQELEPNGRARCDEHHDAAVP